MPFTLRPYRRFPVQCAVTYNAGLCIKLTLVYFLGFGSLITLLLLSNGPAYAEWMRIDKGKPGMTIYVNPDSICRKGETSVHTPASPPINTSSDDLQTLRTQAGQGNAVSQYILAQKYLQGHEVPQDPSEAVKWFRLAAAQGDAGAQHDLGTMYFKGHGVQQDYAEAGKWFYLAAAQGDADAQSSLGAMYINGQGGVKDIVRAYMWFNLGALSGDRDSVRNRDIVAGRMTPAQIAEAQRLSQKCQAQQFKGC